MNVAKFPDFNVEDTTDISFMEDIEDTEVIHSPSSEKKEQKKSSKARRDVSSPSDIPTSFSPRSKSRLQERRTLLRL